MARKKPANLQPIESANSHAKVAELLKKGNDFIVEAAAFGSSYVSEASCGPLYNRSIDNFSTNSNISYLKYNNLINDSVAYQENNGFYNIRDYVILCQTAWKRVPVFYQTIEIMTTLANTGIKWFGGSDDGKKFAKVWWEKVGGLNLSEQSFRELLRSSNLILWRLDGGIKSNKINKFILGEENKDKKGKKSEAARTINIPVKYVVLNPADISAINDCGLNYKPVYYRSIDQATKERLKKLTENPDAKIDISEKLQELINCNIGGQSLEPLDPANIHTLFYRKQDYEPFALPMGFSVLEDINLKLEFKKCDAAVAKTIESMILLVTHGNEPDKGGMNPLVDNALKTVFKTGQPGGRIVVSDYTTKMDFVIPDLKKVIGPEKYAKLDQDINDGLMNIFFGDQKFANIMVKLRVFVAILNYLQQIFLNDFLIPEIKRVGKLVGYTDDEIPVPKFKSIMLDDKTQANRIFTQLAQLGLLTAEETFEAMETGILPSPEDSLNSQKQYRKSRDDNSYYLPLIGAIDPNAPVPVAGGAGGKGGAMKTGRPKGSKKSQKESSKIGWKGGSAANEQFNILKFRENITIANEVANSLESEYKIINNVSKLSKVNKSEIKTILTHLTINEPPEKWKESIAVYVSKQFPEPNLENVGKVEEIKTKYELDDYTGGLMLWSL